QAVESCKAGDDLTCKAACESSAVSISAVVFEGRNKNIWAVASDLLRLTLYRDRKELSRLRDAKPCHQKDDDEARRSCNVPLPGGGVRGTASSLAARHRMGRWSSIDVFGSGDTQSRRRLNIRMAKHRDVVSLGNFDANRIVLAGCQVVALKRAPQPA